MKCGFVSVQGDQFASCNAFLLFLPHTCMVDEYVAISCEVTRGLVL